MRSARLAFELRNPAILLPQFNVVTVHHFPGAFRCIVVIVADEIDGFHELTVTANKVGAIIRHGARSITSVTKARREASPEHLSSSGRLKPVRPG
jgi:hypothetical protein